ncbi:MAG: DNA-directed RNA polymerase subunit beta [Candidatus Omnitrophica bacterium]|nr:DNA-directed RNA polymerase subunit beta [Candidatus Omnitrophota bacterium]
MKKVSFGKIKETYVIPNLLEHQIRSYKEFLQMEIPSEKRKNIGLQEVIKEIFPLESADNKWKLEFVSYNLARPKYTIEECRRRSLTYACPLRLRLRLVGEEEIREQEVYFGDIPLITPFGSFIINGDERVVVSQLQRSPGVYFEEEPHLTGKRLYFARIIPYRGSWLEFRYDINETISAIVDRRRTFVGSQLLRMFGFSSNEDILGAFSDKRYPEIVNTLKKDHSKNQDEALLEFYKKLRPTEPVTLEAAKEVFKRMFLNNKRYDLAKVGRFVINRKLKMDFPLTKRSLDKDTVISVIKHLIRVKQGEIPLDDIDHLSNRRVKLVGELVQHEVRIGLLRVERAVTERFALISGMKEISIQHLINARVFSSQIHDFFGRSPLCQFMDQVNPLAEITHKRRLSALGPGGLSRERAGFEVRDVHPSHYGRICPIETPEGQNIGLITSLTTFSTINPLGFITTPYRKLEDGRLTGKVEYLSADDEENRVIAQASYNIDDSKIKDEFVYVRFKGKFPKVEPKKAEYMEVSPKQIVSVSASLIPFLEHDDANRALMGSNMQRQAVPLLFPEVAFVNTGMERRVAKDTGAALVAKEDGVVTRVDASSIKIGKLTYVLKKFQRSNADTAINQRPLVSRGQKIKRGQTIADGPGTKDGKLSLGRNLLVAFLAWRGYNFEDAILINERLVKEDLLTSVHIERFEVEARETRLGNEEITRDLPNVSEEALKNLDEQGVVRIGARVLPDDILVGKVTPKTEKELTPEDRLLRAIFGEKAADVRDTSLKVPPGVEGVIINVESFQRKEKGRKSKKEKTEELRRLKEIEEYYNQELEIIEEERIRRISEVLNVSKIKAKNLNLDENEEAKEISSVYEERIRELLQERELEVSKIKRGDELPSGVLKRVVVYVAMKRKISAGDKLAGRHGNKGVIAKVLPEEDMPYLEDGTPVDLVLNPLGVPSRMNVGQVLETHLGWAANALGLQAETPVFEGAEESEIKDLLKEANLPLDGKTVVYDGYTGKPFGQKVTVGHMYIMKLVHMVEDKIHARAIGPYSLITQQPLGGKAQFGGQRFGEMEVWALEAYGASFILQEMLTVKSDDVQGRTRIYEAIVKGEHRLHPSTPESFNVLMNELQGLCLDVKVEKSDQK